MLFLLQLLNNKMRNSTSYNTTYIVKTNEHFKNNDMIQAIISKI